jgi:hypothetical protein
MTRGFTYYLATGVYADDVMLSEPLSGSTRITIKKAILSDHGTSVVWSDTYGVGQAVFTGTGTATQAFAIAANSGYWTLDGQTGSGTSGFGIKIAPSRNTGTTLVVGLFTGNTSPGVEIKNLELVGPGEDRLADGTVWTFPGGATCTLPTTATCGWIEAHWRSLNGGPGR